MELYGLHIRNKYFSKRMKYIKRIFESTDFTHDEVEQLKDLCDGALAYLLDEDFHIRVSNKYSKENIRIEIYKGELTSPKAFNWDDVSDYFISFYNILSKNYQIQTNCADCMVKLQYNKPGENLWEGKIIWISHEDMLNNIIEDEKYIAVITLFIEKKKEVR